TCPAIGDYSGQNARLPRRALREFEAADAGVPNASRGVGGCVVFVRVPERAIVQRIDLHGGVVAPATKLRSKQFAVLRTAAGKELRFALAESVQRIAGKPSCIGN